MASVRAKAKYRVETADGSTVPNKRIAGSFREVGASAAILEGPLNGVSGRLTAIGAAVGRVGPAMVGFGVITAGTVSVMRSSVQAAAQYEQQLLRLEGVLRATEGASGLTLEQLDRFAVQLGRDTLTSAQAAREATAALLSFRSISGEAFKETLSLAQDLSAVMGGDLRANVTRLARALEDPATGLTSLRRSGVSFTNAQRDMIIAMQESGDEAGAQAAILQRLREQIGGAGLAEAGGLVGATDSLSESWTQLKEAIGGGLLSDVAEAEARGLTAIFQDLRDVMIRVGAVDDAERRVDQINQRLSQLGFDAATGQQFRRSRNQNQVGLIAALRAEREKLIGQIDRQRVAEKEATRAAEGLRKERQAEIQAAKAAVEQKKTEAEMLEHRLRLFNEEDRMLAKLTRTRDRETHRQQDAISSVIKGLIDEEHALTLTREQLVDFEIQTLGAADGQREFARETVLAIEQLEREQEEAEKATDIARRLGLAFGSAFEDAAISGEKLSDVLLGLGQDLQRLFLRLTVTEPLLESFKHVIAGGGEGSGGGGFAGSLLGLFSGLGGGGVGGGLAPALRFDGPFAEGGHIPAGSFGIAGEKGPEPVFGPATVFPNDALGGVVNNLTQVFNIEGTPAPGVEEIIEEAAARGAARGFAMMQSNIARGKGMARLVGAR